MTSNRWTDFSGTTRQVAKRLLGATLARRTDQQEILRGTIVEVEAYLSTCDPASHSHKGRKNKNASMFDESGTLYVYSIHAKHCVNVVTENAGQGAAVLIRAIEPFEGLELMYRGRGFDQSAVSDDPTNQARQMLTQGPGRLCQAFNITRSLDGVDLRNCQDVWLEPPTAQVSNRRWKVRSGPRIGISKAQSLKLRYFMDGNQFVSGRNRDHSNGRTWTFYFNESTNDDDHRVEFST